MIFRRLIIAFVVLTFVAALGVAGIVAKFSAELPDLIGIAEYKPLLVSEVYDRNGKKFGEFFRQKRILVPYQDIPEQVKQAFVAAEDDTFYSHGGINYLAILRAVLANIRTGKRSQGGSTITQQVARSLLLSSEKTYSRKIKEVLLARKMEETLKKEDILFLYLNQIYLGQGAHGVGAAAEVYFRKNVRQLTVPEAAILAGLPQAPSRYSPISNPSAAKERQKYVLRRMAEVGFIKPADADRFIAEPVKLFVWQSFRDMAPFYLETVRQLLVQELGEEIVWDKGIKIHTSMDLDKQIKAQEQLQAGLRELDKRQGFRGPIKNIAEPSAVAEFLLESRNKFMDDYSPERILKSDGTFTTRGPLNITGQDASGKRLPTLPSYIPLNKIVEGIVVKVDDTNGLTHVRFGEAKGLIDIEKMAWARKPDPNLRPEDAPLKKPSLALKSGDVIQVIVRAAEFSSERLDKLAQELKKKNKGKAGFKLDLPNFKDYVALELEQEPLVEGAILAIDQKTEDLIALVGGYDFVRSKFNRAFQAARQTGSAFKAFVYLAALDKDYTPATPIIDAPIVYDEQNEEGQDEGENKRWRPKNNSNKFGGDILFRNALIKSLNVPTVKIIEKIGVDYSANYARRLGIFSALNMDFTLALGSSSVTLYEMTRAFGIIGRLGMKLSPIVIRKVMDAKGEKIAENITLDRRFQSEISRIEEEFNKKREAFFADPEVENKSSSLFFDNPNQLIRPQTSYVLTSILQGVVDEPGGTGGAARALGRPVAGKTGSTNGYYDAWFVGYTPDVSAGVWVGYDEERSLGRGEVGGKAALPIWLEFMKVAHEGLSPRGFPVPDGVVFANIDNQTGSLVSSQSKAVVRQAFIDGTEPGSASQTPAPEQDSSFYKEDMSE